MASKSDIELWRRPKVSPAELRQLNRRFWMILLLTACLMGALAAWLMLHDTRELRRLREAPPKPVVIQLT